MCSCLARHSALQDSVSCCATCSRIETRHVLFRFLCASPPGQGGCGVPPGTDLGKPTRPVWGICRSGTRPPGRPGSRTGSPR
eukprot:689208-Heterocapsa_arctica.AAC.1